MARLLKFNCQTCGTKLAVPASMAGMSDECPKCGAIVTSPTPKPKEETLPLFSEEELPKREAWSTAELADALRPSATPPPVAAEAPSTQAEPPAQTSLFPPAPEANPVSEAPKTAAAPEAAPSPSAPPPESQEEPLRIQSKKDEEEEIPTAPVSPPAEEAIVSEAEAKLKPEPESQPVPQGEEEVGPDLPAEDEEPAQPEPPAITASAFKINPPKEEEHDDPATLPVASEEAAAPATPSAASGKLLSSLLKESPPLERPSLKTSPLHAAPTTGPSTPTIRSRALVPNTDDEADLAEKASIPGMGEMLAAAGSGTKDATEEGSHPVTTSANRHPSDDHRDKSPLHVLLMSTPPSTKRASKKSKRRKMIIIWITVFAALWAFVIIPFLFGSLISDWWNGRLNKPTLTLPAPAAKTEGEAAPVPAKTEEKEDSVPSAVPIISAPEDFENPSAAAPKREAPVTEAIPFPSPGDLPSSPMDVVSSTPAPPLDLPTTAETGSKEPSAPSSLKSGMALALPDLPDPVLLPGAATPDKTPTVAGAPAPGATAPPSVVSPQVPAPLPLPDAAASSDQSPTVASTAGGLPPPPTDMALPNGPLQPPPLSPAAQGPAEPKVGKLPPQAAPALEVAKKFLNSNTWQERSVHALKADTLKSAMEKHAQTYGDGPIRVASIEFVDRYDKTPGKAPYCMFEVSGGSLKHPVLMLIEQPVKGEPKVDWETFTEFKEDMLLKFLENPNAAPEKFRVMMRRKHYFDKDVPDLKNKDSFSLSFPHSEISDSRFEGHVFIPKNTELSRLLSSQLPWEHNMPLIAELVWKKEGSLSWVEVKAIASYGWRGDLQPLPAKR